MITEIKLENGVAEYRESSKVVVVEKMTIRGVPRRLFLTRDDVKAIYHLMESNVRREKRKAIKHDEVTQ